MTRLFFIGKPVAPNYRIGLLRRKKKWLTAHPKGVACPTPPSMGPISARRERVISGRLANRFGSRFGTNTNYCLELFALYPRRMIIQIQSHDVRKLQKQCPPTVPTGKASTVLQLSPCVWKVFPEYAIYRSNRNIFTCHRYLKGFKCNIRQK